MVGDTMPFVIIGAILIACGLSCMADDNRKKRYKHNDTSQMLKQMTGKSKTEKRRIFKKYGRK